MSKKIYNTLSIVFFSIAGVIFVYLFLGNAAVITHHASMAEAASRWSLFPYLFLSFIAGIVFTGLSIKKAFIAFKQAPNGSCKYNQSNNRTYGTNFNNNKNSHKQFIDDLTRQQHEQFMNEMNMQQQQQLMDEMNRQQQQQFMDWSMEESLKNVTPFEHGGYDMNQGNSFNNDNFGNGF